MLIEVETEIKLRELLTRLRKMVGIDAVFEQGNAISIKCYRLSGAVFGDNDIVSLCSEYGFIANLQSSNGQLSISMIPIKRQLEGIGRRKIPWINLILFFLTFGSMTLSVPLFQTGEFSLNGVLAGFSYSVPLMAILLFHESGHYIASRRHKVRVTLPYFIPAPTFLGTFGAIIKMKSPISNRLQLLDVGAAGPISGFVVALLAVIIGLSRSELIVTGAAGMTLGDSLIFRALVFIFFGNIPDGYDLSLHPVAFAGWVGLFVTMMNLLPYGQLDGGHIAYALFGNKYKWVSRIAVIAMLPLGFLWPGWFLWAFFLILLASPHPPTIDETIELDGKRKIIGYISLIIFALTFTPVPFG